MDTSDCLAPLEAHGAQKAVSPKIAPRENLRPMYSRRSREGRPSSLPTRSLSSRPLRTSHAERQSDGACRLRYFAFTMVLCQKKNGRTLRKHSSHPIPQPLFVPAPWNWELTWVTWESLVRSVPPGQ